MPLLVCIPSLKAPVGAEAYITVMLPPTLSNVPMTPPPPAVIFFGDGLLSLQGLPRYIGWLCCSLVPGVVSSFSEVPQDLRVETYSEGLLRFLCPGHNGQPRHHDFSSSVVVVWTGDKLMMMLLSFHYKANNLLLQ